MKLSMAYIRTNLALSIPIVSGQAGQIATNIADNAMVGNYDGVHLAASSIANGLFAIVLVLAMGYAIAILPLASEQWGADQENKAISVFKNALGICVAISLLLGVFLVWFDISWLGQDTAIQSLAEEYLLYSAASLPFAIAFMCYKHFLESYKDTKVTMWITIVGNALNIFLNWIFIFGQWGFPELGLIGAGIATLIARIAMFLAVIIYFYGIPKYKAFKEVLRNTPWNYAQMRAVHALGFPNGLQYVFEISAFAGAGIMAGWITIDHLAAHQVALNIAAVNWSIISGVGAAVTIQIGYLIGNKKVHRLKKTLHAGYAISTIYMIVAGCLLFIFREPIVRFFTESSTIQELAASLILIAVLFQIFDGAQAIGINALRGFQDVWIPTGITMVSYTLMGSLLGYILSFPLGLGLNGIWMGLCIGLIVASVLFYWRGMQQCRSHTNTLEK